MRFSIAVAGLLFGLEAAALKAVPRTVPEIERAVCIISYLCRARRVRGGQYPAWCLQATNRIRA